MAPTRGRRPSATPGGPKATRSGNPPSREWRRRPTRTTPGRTRNVLSLNRSAFPAHVVGCSTHSHWRPGDPPPPTTFAAQGLGRTSGKPGDSQRVPATDEHAQGAPHRQGCRHEAEPGRLGDRRGGPRHRGGPQPEDPGQRAGDEQVGPDVEAHEQRKGPGRDPRRQERGGREVVDTTLATAATRGRSPRVEMRERRRRSRPAPAQRPEGDGDPEQPDEHGEPQDVEHPGEPRAGPTPCWTATATTPTAATGRAGERRLSTSTATASTAATPIPSATPFRPGRYARPVPPGAAERRRRAATRRARRRRPRRR